ncbi:MAG: response regulator [Verrucomicrobiia bacterium]
MSTASNPLNLLTVKETADYLRIPVPTVYYLVQRGQLPAIQIGGRWRIKKDRLDEEVLKLNDGTSGKSVVSNARILVVDDQQEILDLLQMALSSKGYKPDTISSGNAALDLLQKTPYDLMFLDLHLPDISGEELFEKASDLQPDLHVVIMTGFSTVQSLEKILACGPVTVLQKPFKIEQLLRVTRLILGQPA